VTRAALHVTQICDAGVADLIGMRERERSPVIGHGV
jgi:hypothetical protein